MGGRFLSGALQPVVRQDRGTRRQALPDRCSSGGRRADGYAPRGIGSPSEERGGTTVASQRLTYARMGCIWQKRVIAGRSKRVIAAVRRRRAPAVQNGWSRPLIVRANRPQPAAVCEARHTAVALLLRRYPSAQSALAGHGTQAGSGTRTCTRARRDPLPDSVPGPSRQPTARRVPRLSRTGARPPAGARDPLRRGAGQAPPQARSRSGTDPVAAPQARSRYVSPGSRVSAGTPRPRIRTRNPPSARGSSRRAADARRAR